jgi:hypothetical protein
MPKPIPTLGLTNWGQPLNEHLAQLNNPITGGINTFDTFSQRPTTLTAVDNGKTYLYTQTGNIHQWTGTNWKVLNESHINVKDFGAVGDGVVDDTAAVQSAINFAQSKVDGSTVFFPAAKYKLSSTVTINCDLVDIEGDGSTFLCRDITSGSALLITSALNFFSTRSRHTFNNFTLAGGYTVGVKGIEFSAPNAGASALLNFMSISIHTFETSIIIKDNAYIINFFGCNILNIDGNKPATMIRKHIQLDVAVNSGERITFIGCTIANAELCVEGNNPNSSMYFSTCSFDYASSYCTLNGGSAIFDACYFETSIDTTYLFNLPDSGDGGARLLISSSYLFLTGNRTNAIAYVGPNKTWGGMQITDTKIDLFLNTYTPKHIIEGKGRALIKNIETQEVDSLANTLLSENHNICASGGFAGSNISGWTLGAAFGYASPVIDTGGGVGGTPALKFEVTTNGQSIVAYYDIPVQIGQHVIIGFDHKNLNSTNFFPTLEAFDLGGASLGQINGFNINTPINTYTYQKFSAIAPKGCAKVRLQFNTGNANAVGSASWVDNVEINIS